MTLRDWPRHPDLPSAADLPTSRPAIDLRARLDRLPASHPSARDYDGADATTQQSQPAPEDRVVEHAPETAGDEKSSWNAPGLAMYPDRPSPADIRLTADRREHILDGDATGGGHRHGTGHPGKTEFPADWTDARIGEAILSVARAPDQLPVRQNWNERWRVRGTYDGVDVVAIVESGGSVWTAWPLESSAGVVKNKTEDA
jgi:hypothetical protein